MQCQGGQSPGVTVCGPKGPQRKQLRGQADRRTKPGGCSEVSESSSCSLPSISGSCPLNLAGKQTARECEDAEYTDILGMEKSERWGERTEREGSTR